MKGLDYETFSEVDIKTHGLDRYVNHPSFKVLWAGVDHGTYVQTIDFVFRPNALAELQDALGKNPIVAAHNAGFERAVSKTLGIGSDVKYVDSAVIARACGAGSKLEVAAPQLLDLDKLEMGANLINIFSVPTKANGGKPYTREQIVADPDLYKKWQDFGEYCGVDAMLSRQIAEEKYGSVPEREWSFEWLTQQMNNHGWYVDMDLVHEMQAQYEQNLSELEHEFQIRYDPTGNLNFRSHPQLVKWCADHGVKAKSFDQQHLPRLMRAVEQRMTTGSNTTQQVEDFRAVYFMLRIKQERGGSSLSKLKTIIAMTGEDGRLRNQYLHVGAGQTYRTSGRGVQLQNLPRLPEKIGDVEQLMHEDTIWDNAQLAANLRQTFKAEHPDGELIVGDFKSVESRMLAYLAGAEWKLDAYRQDRDMYKVLATTYSSFNGVRYEDVTKPQRQAGKVGELACGYGAGGGAVKGFAEKMGIDMSDAESSQIVFDWRGANPEVVVFWRTLDDMLHQIMQGGGYVRHPLPHGGSVVLADYPTPPSLERQHPGSRSIELSVIDKQGAVYLRRVFHGCYYRGKDVCYYKPSELKSGNLWRARSTTPPHFWYKLYGGKLAGILTQSFCRELFFHSMRTLNSEASAVSNVKLIGQFHDELVLEWRPMASRDEPYTWTLADAIGTMTKAMSDPYPWAGFPLAADVKHAHRYIK